MNTPRTLSRLTDRKRAAIINAAIIEFRQSGYEATSMDRLAASAGVSKRTVYNHFPSKEALFAQIIQQLWELSGRARSDLSPRPPAASAASGTGLAEASVAARPEFR